MRLSIPDHRREWVAAVRRNRMLIADAFDREDWTAVARLAEGMGRAARLIVMLDELLVGEDNIGVLRPQQSKP